MHRLPKEQSLGLTIVGASSSPDRAFFCSAACGSGTRQEGIEMHAASVHLDIPARVGLDSRICSSCDSIVKQTFSGCQVKQSPMRSRGASEITKTPSWFSGEGRMPKQRD